MVFVLPINCMIAIPLPTVFFEVNGNVNVVVIGLPKRHNLLLALDFYSCINLNAFIAIKHGKCYERSACGMVI